MGVARSSQAPGVAECWSDESKRGREAVEKYFGGAGLNFLFRQGICGIVLHVKNGMKNMKTARYADNSNSNQ